MKKTYIKILKKLQKSINAKLTHLEPPPKNDSMEIKLEFYKDNSTFNVTTNDLYENKSGIKNIEAKAVIDVKVEYNNNGFKTIKAKGKVKKVDIGVPLSTENIYDLGENKCFTKKK